MILSDEPCRPKRGSTGNPSHFAVSDRVAVFPLLQQDGSPKYALLAGHLSASSSLARRGAGPPAVVGRDLRPDAPAPPSGRGTAAGRVEVPDVGRVFQRLGVLAGRGRLVRYLSPSCETITGYPLADAAGSAAIAARIRDVPKTSRRGTSTSAPAIGDATTGAVAVAHPPPGWAIVWLDHVCRPILDASGSSWARAFRLGMSPNTSRPS
jgi:hypothetical protein